MSFLRNLLEATGIQPARVSAPAMPARQKKIMQVTPHGDVPYAGNLPAAQQQDTYDVNNSPAPVRRSPMMIRGMNPQGYPGPNAESIYPQPNMQQLSQPLLQGITNPGLIPLQGSRGVSDISLQGTRSKHNLLLRDYLP